MPETASPARSRSLLAASGGTAFAAVLFLVVAVGSLLAWHGVFSAGIALMLAAYGAVLGAIALAGWRGQRWAAGAMVASSLLHVLVAASTARGSHQPWLWLLAGVAALTLVFALRVHLDDLRSRHQE